MNESILLEKASTEHLESFCKAIDIVAKERKFLPISNGIPKEDANELIQKIREKNYPQYFAMEHGEVVAWCDIIPKPFEEMKHVGTLEMGMLANYRGCGIGTELMRKTIEHARTINKIERVELEVYESNRYAIELYKRMGFNIEGKKPKARKINGSYDNIIVMGKLIK